MAHYRYSWTSYCRSIDMVVQRHESAPNAVGYICTGTDDDIRPSGISCTPRTLHPSLSRCCTQDVSPQVLYHDSIEYLAGFHHHKNRSPLHLDASALCVLSTSIFS
ncbi:hypothetical protein ACN47E_009535 [Coniothyrium glycines]